MHDPIARLWAQAERTRAYLVANRDDNHLVATLKTLRRFLSTATPGLWFDQLDERSKFVAEPARATQLYHIMNAIAELSATVPEPVGADPPVQNRCSPAPRLIYLVTEDWYFISHRLPMARAAREAGFEVHVATRIDRHGAAIEAEGFRLHPIRWRRGSFDPRDLFQVVREVRQLYRALKPDLAHHVALPAIVVGSLAAIGLPVACLNAMTGLGTLFISDHLKVRSVRTALRPALRALLNRAGAAVLVQNVDDRIVVESLGVDPARIALIPGSGVDTDAITPSPEPAGGLTIAFVGRLVEAKGIRTLVEAHRLLYARGHNVKLIIAGVPDPGNPSAIPAAEIEEWSGEANVHCIGYVEDIRTLWASAHIAVLPSRREGLPLSLLEAAACGRPLVATDVPGCRAIARPDFNAILVPIGDVEALARAIERLRRDPELRRHFGTASRTLVEREFSAHRIGKDIVALYRRLLQQEPSVADTVTSV